MNLNLYSAHIHKSPRRFTNIIKVKTIKKLWKMKLGKRLIDYHYHLFTIKMQRITANKSDKD